MKVCKSENINMNNSWADGLRGKRRKDSEKVLKKLNKS